MGGQNRDTGTLRWYSINNGCSVGRHLFMQIEKGREQKPDDHNEDDTLPSFIIEEIDASTCEIITPYLDKRNDNISLFIDSEDGLMLHDGGYVLSELEMSGVDVKVILVGIDAILDRWGISRKNTKLYKEIGGKDFGYSLDSFIQAILQLYYGEEHEKT